ncbi:MAG: hypothetical protein QM774_08685 [Gordonia sp. (in: high G+C Gram-positive bacteria)]|uniref:sacsin N-terminal ATP-binding-like domain-containing protein n=1 Tax=Gordonia sp. (in: high G+C Gram-positive bacteria) TaxID=84139 RepID=UPI0039E57BCC
MTPPHPRTPSDPFGTASLRDATLAAWRDSPTRLAEDAAAEADLSAIGYRDRLITELAANAADAAAGEGGVGRLRVTVDGPRLRVANTGAPLTAAGVRALTALRVSPKNGSASGSRNVGRFGVGFRATAYLPRVDVLSRSGGITFDAARTADALDRAGIAAPDGRPAPAQRLAWPAAEPPADGYDTEVVLHTPGPEHAASLAEQARAEAEDLLLELPALIEIDVAGEVFTRTDDDGDVVTILADGRPRRRWLTSGTYDTPSGPVRWLVPIDGDGRPTPIGEGEVLRSPTPTGVPLSLPARLIAGLPLTPDRRALHPDTDIADAAAGYPELVASVRDDAKHLLIPDPVLAAGPEDARLRTAIDQALRHAQWVPAAGGEALAPDRAWVLRGLTPGLSDVLGDVVEPLVHPDLSDGPPARALLRLGAKDLGLAELADLLTGVDRAPEWWGELYDALAALVPDADAAAELGALPVPRADGRLQRGARGLFTVDGAVPTARIDWIPTVDSRAARPLLDRLGLEHLSVAQVLEHPALLGEIENADAEGGEAWEDLADTVLLLLAADEKVRAPAALGRIELPARDGTHWPADELVLPDAPLRTLIADPDADLGVVDDAMVAAYGADPLRRLGVGWGFTVLTDELPTAPDHDLDAEEDWWDGLDVPPERLVAIRDLDLVDPDRWPQALDVLLADDRTAPLLSDPDGYPVWWLRRYAEIGGRRLRELRAPDDDTLRGVTDPLDHPAADRLTALLAGPEPDDAVDAAARLAALADPDRDIAPGVAARVHAGLVTAIRTGRLAVDDLDPPDGVRTLDGTVSAGAVVAEHPWWVPVLPPSRTVLAGPVPDPASAAVLADLLDIPTASRRYAARVVSDGEAVDRDSAVAAREIAATGEVPDGPIVVHDALTVAVFATGTGAEIGRHRVPRWRDDARTWHLSEMVSRP